jgi:hypothetical protein
MLNLLQMIRTETFKIWRPPHFCAKNIESSDISSTLVCGLQRTISVKLVNHVSLQSTFDCQQDSGRYVSFLQTQWAVKFIRLSEFISSEIVSDISQQQQKRFRCKANVKSACLYNGKFSIKFPSSISMVHNTHVRNEQPASSYTTAIRTCAKLYS